MRFISCFCSSIDGFEYVIRKEKDMSNNQASKRLAKGTLVYMIGNMSSKILQMLILPIITAALATSEYGYYDLVVTTINLITPVVTVQIIEGMFRFLFNASDEEKKKTVSTVTAFLAFGILVLAIIIFAIHIAIPSIDYPWLIYFNYVSCIVFTYMQKLARCQQKNKVFAISGVINTAVMLATQIVVLLVLHMSVDGMLIANAISYIAASIYIGGYVDIKKWLHKDKVDKKTLNTLLRYSAPLVPNSVAWWIVASSDRYVITFFLGTAANGVYSIAGKFSQLLTFVTSVFQLAWQESAIMEENSDARDKFYTDTFNMYMKLLLGGYLIILPFIKIIIPFLLADSYLQGYLYNPVLLIGAVFAAFSQFYGSAYLVFKKTSGAFTTTIIAAFVNILIGLGLIRYIGLFAPALGTSISFMVQWIIRAYQMREYFRVKIGKKSMVVLLAFACIVTYLYYFDSIGWQFLAFGIGMIVFLVVNKGFIESVIKKLKK